MKVSLQLSIYCKNTGGLYITDVMLRCSIYTYSIVVDVVFYHDGCCSYDNEDDSVMSVIIGVVDDYDDNADDDVVTVTLRLLLMLY